MEDTDSCGPLRRPDLPEPPDEPLSDTREFTFHRAGTRGEDLLEVAPGLHVKGSTVTQSPGSCILHLIFSLGSCLPTRNQRCRQFTRASIDGGSRRDSGSPTCFVYVPGLVSHAYKQRLNSGS